MSPQPGALHHPLSRCALALLAALGVALAYWLPAFVRPFAQAGDDWAYFTHMWELGWIAATRFGEVALWDPYQCGGVPMFGDPQAQIYGPWFLLAFLVGTTLALKLGIVLHAAASLLGMYTYAASIHRLSPLASAFAAAVFTGSGFFAWHVAIGHVPFLPFFLMPLVLVCYHRACTEPRASVWLALLLTLMLFEGGVHPLPFALLVLGFEALVRALRTRRALESFAPLAMALLGMALLGGLRWIPSLLELQRYPRPVRDLDLLGLGDLWQIFTKRVHVGRVPGHKWPWHEYSCFIGIGALALVLLGAGCALWRRRAHLLIGALTFLSVACGQLGEWSPWALLQRLPVFDSLRIPSRFLVLAVLFGALLAALALDQLAALLARWPRVARVSTAAVAFTCVLDIFLVTRPIVDVWRREPLPPVPRKGERAAFSQVPADGFKAFLGSTPRLGHGTVGCYTVLEYVPAPSLQVGPVPQAEVWLGEATLSNVRVRVNRMRLEVEASSAVTIVFNQNYSPDFISNVGAPYALEGRLAVDLEPGRHSLRVDYRPQSLPLGLGCTALGVLAILSYTWWLRRRGQLVQTPMTVAA